MPDYDPEQIAAFIDKLNAKARLSIFIYAAYGLGLALAALALADSLTRVPADMWWPACGITTALGAIIGHHRGSQLRIEAMRLRCQMQLIENTTRATAAHSAM